MTDEQFSVIEKLLKDILSAVENVDSNTGNISYVEDYVKKSSEYLKNISDSH